MDGSKVGCSVLTALPSAQQILSPRAPWAGGGGCDALGAAHLILRTKGDFCLLHNGLMRPGMRLAP